MLLSCNYINTLTANIHNLGSVCLFGQRKAQWDTHHSACVVSEVGETKSVLGLFVIVLSYEYLLKNI